MTFSVGAERVSISHVIAARGAVKEKLQEYALLAEIIGGISIVLSLIFVGVQVRQNNELNLANTYRELLSDINQVQSVMMTDENAHRVWLSFIDGETESMSRSDYVRLRLIVSSLLRVYESAFYAFSYSQLGTSEWRRMQDRICNVTSNVTNQLWKDVSQVVSEDFREFIETEC